MNDTRSIIRFIMFYVVTFFLLGDRSSSNVDVPHLAFPVIILWSSLYIVPWGTVCQTLGNILRLKRLSVLYWIYKFTRNVDNTTFRDYSLVSVSSVYSTSLDVSRFPITPESGPFVSSAPLFPSIRSMENLHHYCPERLSYLNPLFSCFLGSRRVT